MADEDTPPGTTGAAAKRRRRIAVELSPEAEEVFTSGVENECLKSREALNVLTISLGALGAIRKVQSGMSRKGGLKSWEDQLGARTDEIEECIKCLVSEFLVLERRLAVFESPEAAKIDQVLDIMHRVGLSKLGSSMSAVEDVVRGAEEISKQTEGAISEVVKAVNKVETAVDTMELKVRSLADSVKRLEADNDKQLGRMYESVERVNGSVTEGVATIASSVTRVVEAMGDVGAKVSTLSMGSDVRTGAQVASYAQVAGGSRAVGPKGRVVIEAGEGWTGGEEDMAKDFRAAVNPSTSGWQIVGMRRRGKGAVVLETPSTDAAKVVAEDPVIVEKGLKARVVGPRNPRLIMYDVPREVTIECIRKCLVLQNGFATLEERLNSEFMLSFLKGPRSSPRVNYVVEVSPAIRNELLKLGRVFIEFSSCRVEDFCMVSRCFKCQGLGHVAKTCRAESFTCRHCGKVGHKEVDCPSKDSAPKCGLCARFNKPADHSVFDVDCPAWKRACEGLRSVTDYGC